MVRIRLRRTGKKKQASFRVVIADSEAPRDGRFIENVGFYNPRTDPPTIELKEDRIRYWLSQGAQPSDPVVWMLRKVGILSGEGAPAATMTQDELEADADADVEAAEESEAGDETEVEAEEEFEADDETEVETSAE